MGRHAHNNRQGIAPAIIIFISLYVSATFIALGLWYSDNPPAAPIVQPATAQAAHHASAESIPASSPHLDSHPVASKPLHVRHHVQAHTTVHHASHTHHISHHHVQHHHHQHHRSHHRHRRH